MEKRDFLAQIARLVRETGVFTRSGEAGPGTATEAFWIAQDEKVETLPSDEDYQFADAALAYAASVPSDASQYVKKAASACLAVGEVQFSKVNLIASIFEIAQRDSEDKAFSATFADSKSLSHPVGYELTLRSVRVEQMRTIMAAGFERHIVKFSTPEGNILTWWASRMPQVKVGQNVRFNGRVKGPSEYQSVHDTLVTRCQLGIIPTRA
jgi:hypothetical protein